MSRPRRKLTTLDKLKVLVRQAVCPRCGEKLGTLADTEFDHVHALALGGEDTIDNIVGLHVDCHARKTNGTKATTAGSDKHMIAKLKRADKTRDEAQRRLLKSSKRSARKAGGKIPSRPFPKRPKTKDVHRGN